MIDIENAVYSRVALGLREAFGEKGIFVSSEYTDSPAQFPAAMIFEADNSVYQRMRTTSIENGAKLLYQADVFSNLIGRKKAQAQEIMDIIDREFAGMGFTRTMCQPVSNLMDAKIYRMTARYEGIADKTRRIYTH